jgi:Lar family restriction alleviation protein
MENKIELLPCPFCGGQATNPWKDISAEEFKITGLAFEIRCQNCFAKILSAESMEVVVCRWNRRSQ